MCLFSASRPGGRVPVSGTLFTSLTALSPAVQPCLAQNLHSVSLSVTITFMFIVEEEELGRVKTQSAVTNLVVNN